MRLGSIILVIWLIIGAIVGGQRGYYQSTRTAAARAPSPSRFSQARSTTPASTRRLPADLRPAWHDYPASKRPLDTVSVGPVGRRHDVTVGDLGHGATDLVSLSNGEARSLSKLAEMTVGQVPGARPRT